MKQRSLMFSPSLYAGDFSRAGLDIEEISASGADFVHFDVMDGSFVPEITFGAKFIEDLRPLSDLVFDVHLMVDNPERHIKRIADAGAGIITIHAEATRHIWKAITSIKELGLDAGVAINPGTSVSTIRPILEIADYILVMTVNPGWSGQRFIPECIDKIGELNRLRIDCGYTYSIGADGGVSRGNIATLWENGVDLAVIGSAFFREEDKAAFLNELEEIAGA